MKKYVKYFSEKKGLRLITVIIIILLGGAFTLGMLAAQEMKRMISEDFNNQQLELARHTADILTENFKIIKRELLTLSLSPSIQYIEAVSWANRMKIALSSVGDYGVFRIILVDADGTKSYSMNYNNAVFVKPSSYRTMFFFEWCKKPENKNKIYISDVRKGIVANSEPGLFMHICTPVYKISSDEAHPRPSQQFSGVLVFVLDVASLVKKYVAPIQSGKTGYGWVIDEEGDFLYHLEKDFVGENAFKVRKFKDSHISFSKINLIQKTKMLQGKEGTSWYISGWHRGVTGKMKKLIGYAPVHIGAANATRTWSVAVVAPISEVEGAIHTVYVRQAMIQGAFTAAVLIILAFLIANERAWLRTLEQEVEKKTEDLARYAERLKLSEERYRSLVESADDLIYSLGKDGEILSVNQYTTRLLKRCPTDIIGTNITKVIKYEAPDNIDWILDKVFATSESVAHEERVKIADRQYWLDTKYKALLTDEEHVGAVLVISRDITEQKSIEEQLFHTEKLASLGSLSAGVAHEINNPLAIILGFTDVLLERVAENSKEHEILKIIERQGNNCKSIIENLLAFARIPEKTTTETDVLADLQKIVNVVMNTLVTKKIDLKTDIEEDLPKVNGDGQQMEQIFLNIINNAVAAMEGGGILSVSAHRSDHTVSISFTDTGCGIPQENMDKIFEPFFTTKKVGEGTGLGLAVSYGIVKRFGGDIRVKSQTKEEGREPGTTFTILLPVANTKNRVS
ncbi:MAG: PAS domain S-box protein [Desulfobacterales bacterium]|nr:PAS domain S-box protein [Desulfobacterales bacterium]